MNLKTRLRIIYYQMFGWPDIPMTQAAWDLIQLTGMEYEEMLVEKAHQFATREGHPEAITAQNVIDASKVVIWTSNA